MSGPRHPDDPQHRDMPIDGDRRQPRADVDSALRRVDPSSSISPCDVDRLAAFGLTTNVRVVPQGMPGPTPVSHDDVRVRGPLG